MDAALAISLLSILVAALAALYARQSARTAESALVYQVLVNALSEYRSPEMFVAIKALWRFAREHPGEIAEAYKAQRLRDGLQLDELEQSQRLVFEQTTIHYHRRLVSQFYGLLAGLKEQGLARTIVYSHWTEADLRIIPEVLLPMEDTLRAALGSPMPPTLRRLKSLYDDCPR